MNKKIFITGLIACGIITACVFLILPNGTDQASDIKAAEPGVMMNIYSDLLSDSPRTPSLELANIYALNDYLGFPDGNTLKMHDVCYDEDLEQGYAAGIMSSDIAIFKDDEVFAYVDTNLGVGDFELKELTCGNGLAFVSTENYIVKIDGETLEIVKTMKMKQSISANSTHLHTELNLLTLAVPDTQTHMVYDPSSMAIHGQITGERMSTFVAESGQLMTVEVQYDDTQEEIESYLVKYLNPDTLEEEDSLTIDSRIDSISTQYNKATNDLWFLRNDGMLLAIDLDDLDGKPTLIDTELPEVKELAMSDDYAVVLTANGYDYDGFGDFYGGVVVIDAQKKKILHEVPVAANHKSIELDLNENMAYITNNDANSVSRIDLEKGELEAWIVVGSSSEGGAVASDGSLYIRNRLGGSTVMHLDPDTDNDGQSASLLANIEPEDAWPVGIAYSPSLDRVVTYDFLGSSVSLIDPQTDQIIETYEASVPDGSTDGIGSSTYDYTRNILYMAIPEQNAVVAMDITNGEELAVIEIEDYLDGANYQTIQGAGALVPITYEPTAKLFVYAQRSETFYVYDGLNNYQFEGIIQVEDIEGDIKKMPYGLFVDQANAHVHVGSKIYDADTFEYLGDIKHGDAVAAADYENGLLLTVSIDSNDDDAETLHVLDSDGNHLDEIDLSSNQYVAPRFTYDDAEGILYIFYMVPSEVWAVQIF
jgi:DNA-binding beta-propeller fold protein YncE